MASLSVAGSIPGIGGSLTNGSFPYGLAMRFKVFVGGLSLGSWSACNGLKVDLKATMVAEGGNYWYKHVLPERVEYPNITLERAVHPQEYQQVQDWLLSVATKWHNYSGSGEAYTGETATITLLGASGQKVAKWTLGGVYPVSWTGPTLSATESKVAIEKLELAHEGFLGASSGPEVPTS